MPRSGVSQTARPLQIFFSVGEPSGDLHAANLIRELRRRSPQVQCVGFGGPQMASAGCQLHFELTSLAVMWFLRVLLNLGTFFRLARQAHRTFRQQRPDAVVLVDYPGFNWWIARRAKSEGIPVFYYTPPQIWAWGSWRVNKMRRFVDHVLCSLPFEQAWFRQHGCRAEFVGHPFFDEVRRRPLDERFLAELRSAPGPLVTLLPGSRNQEVEHNLADFLRTAAQVRRQVPSARFAVAAFQPRQAQLARQKIAQSGLEIPVYVGRTAELMAGATCCVAVSGSVSLELLYYRKPTVIHYRIGRLAYWVQNQFRRVKYITLVNLLASDTLYSNDLTPYAPGQPDADQVPFPEYLTCQDKSAQLAAHVVEWLIDSGQLARRVAQLESLAERVAHGGASERAAQYLLDALGGPSGRIARPHFRASRAAPATAAEPARQGVHGPE